MFHITRNRRVSHVQHDTSMQNSSLTDCDINILSEVNEEWPMIIFPFRTHYSPTPGDSASDTLDHRFADSTTQNRDINRQRLLMKW
ncbi:hypothetical protein CEXT_812121 [Caerostris extrusa]|uniref:Uncharacterized protein n=1 Tax=Caerostris extrusa TaxID=172846 RepID=A0AAV4XE97_CAEEX|nr:hypothetical protein CEXT_812121 [Caerostris extrusa]